MCRLGQQKRISKNKVNRRRNCDELGWLPPRLTFDADGRSAGEGRLRRPVCDSTASVSRLLNASLDPATLSACTCKRGKS